MNKIEYINEIGKKAKLAARHMAYIDTNFKNEALLNIAMALENRCDEILSSNMIDIENAKKKGTSESMLDRLMLDKKRVVAMADGIREIVKLDDPVGYITKMWTRPNGIQIGEMRVPLGVIGIIYEARPNVTVDAAALCLKAGNAVILRGGSEAINSNISIAKIINKASVESGLPEGCVQLIEDTDREFATLMMKLNEYIDVLIPRGGAGLINSVVKNSTVPVIQTGVGNCHIYIDKDADIDMGTSIVINAKTQRPAVCNAMETLLVHSDIADSFLPKVCSALRSKNVEISGCDVTQKIVKNLVPADETDWKTEYLDLKLAVKVVSSIDEAIDHINLYGTGHSEAIITNNYNNSRKFLKMIDAAAVYVNASTRFTDGSEFGFGAEIGISTQKLHARGPMGVTHLTTSKYVVYGEGQVRK